MLDPDTHGYVLRKLTMDTMIERVKVVLNRVAEQSCYPVAEVDEDVLCPEAVMWLNREKFRVKLIESSTTTQPSKYIVSWEHIPLFLWQEMLNQKRPIFYAYILAKKTIEVIKKTLVLVAKEGKFDYTFPKNCPLIEHWSRNNYDVTSNNDGSLTVSW